MWHESYDDRSGLGEGRGGGHILDHTFHDNSFQTVVESGNNCSNATVSRRFEAADHRRRSSI